MLSADRFIQAYNKQHSVNVKEPPKQPKKKPVDESWETEVEDVILISEPLIIN